MTQGQEAGPFKSELRQNRSNINGKNVKEHFPRGQNKAVSIAVA